MSDLESSASVCNYAPSILITFGFSPSHRKCLRYQMTFNNFSWGKSRNATRCDIRQQQTTIKKLVDVEDKCETITQIAIKLPYVKKKTDRTQLFYVQLKFHSLYFFFGNFSMSGAVENKCWNELSFFSPFKNMVRHMASSLREKAKLEKLNYKLASENREKSFH